jgi:phage-related minor tail protein
MAGKIKGITIEIGGDVSSLNKALKDVNKKSRDLQGELRQVERLLKLDPRNTELVAQKQKLLGEAVANTKEKLETLREAQKQVQEQFERGEISEEQYRALQREIIKTEQNLKKLEKQMQDLEQEEQDVAETTKKLETFFKATDTSVDKFADTLGADLTNAIKKGEASSKQLDDALDKVGQAALGADADLDRMKKALASVDDGNSLANVRKELDSIEREAKEAGKEVEGLGIELENIAGALAAGGGIAGVVGEALDMASLDTQIDVIFSVPEESKKAVKDAVRDIEAYGVDAGEALEGVRRQWALNKDASNEMNTSVTKGAAAIARAYQGIDFTELIQENNEISRSLDISNEAALGLVGSLLKAGFPPEQLDIISEYGTQLEMAGYNAEEIQAIFAAGVETGTWNIDNLLDGLKEGRIRMAEFGQEIPKAMQELLAQTDISAAQFQKWGQQVAAGGEGGKQAMQEVAQALMSVDDETTRNAIGVQIFGTMWEDQGTNVADTLLNMDGHLTTAKENQDKLNQAVSQIDSDPSVKMTQAINDMKAALEPILSVVADVISVLAEWASNNPTLVATIVAIVTILGVVIGICAALAPILVVVKTAAAAMGVAIGAIAAPIAIAIAAIAAIIAIGVLLWKNWDTIKEKAAGLWKKISTTFENIKKAIGDKIGAAKDKVKDAIDAIVGFFRKVKIPEIKIPKIKLPHFSISGKFDLVPPGLSVPKINVRWYDEGGIFRNPAIIGVAERRPEFVGALDDLRYIVRDELNKSRPAVVTAGGPEVHLHIGTLVADEMGLKKLENTLRKFRISEDQRRGDS